MYALGPEFIDVTWGAGGSTSELTLQICNTAQAVYGLETCMHLTCTNMPRESIDMALKQAVACGIQNILALRGDPPRGQDNWVKVDTGFAYAVDLVRYIRKEYGDYFCIGVAAYPEGHIDSEDKDIDIKYFVDKQQAGADYAVTQLFYDVDYYCEWLQKCKLAGITIPILPGIMPIQSYAGFKRMTSLSKTIVPAFIDRDLDPIKDDDKAVKEYGIKLAIEMCKKLQTVAVSGFHFYTLNLEKSVRLILEGLQFVAPFELVKPLPWNPSLAKNREKETVRPIFWRNRPKSYILRTEAWDEYPNGRWGDSRSPAYGELDGYGMSLKYSAKDCIAAWNKPGNIQDVCDLFCRYITGDVKFLPWSDSPLSLESGVIKDHLTALNKAGFLTINSQPAVDGAPSSDRVFGWGPKNGFIYQKAYLEFFISPKVLNRLITKIGQHPYLTYYAVNRDGDLKTNNLNDTTTAVTWGVFPGQEIIQPTVVDSTSFMAWKDEAFGLWKQWADIYEANSAGRSVIDGIADEWYLMNVVDNNFKDVEGIFNQTDFQVKARKTVDAVLDFWDKTYFSACSPGDQQAEQSYHSKEKSGDASWKYNTKTTQLSDSFMDFETIYLKTSRYLPIPRATGSVNFKYTSDGMLSYRFEHHRLTHSIKLPEIDSVSETVFEYELEKLLAPPPIMVEHHVAYTNIPSKVALTKASNVGEDDALDRIELSKLKYDFIVKTTLDIPTKRISDIISAKLKVSDAIAFGNLLIGENLYSETEHTQTENAVDEFDYLIPDKFYNAQQLMGRASLNSISEHSPALINAKVAFERLITGRGIVLPIKKSEAEVRMNFDNIVIPADDNFVATLDNIQAAPNTTEEIFSESIDKFEESSIGSEAGSIDQLIENHVTDSNNDRTDSIFANEGLMESSAHGLEYSTNTAVVIADNDEWVIVEAGLVEAEFVTDSTIDSFVNVETSSDETNDHVISNKSSDDERSVHGEIGLQGNPAALREPEVQLPLGRPISTRSLNYSPSSSSNHSLVKNSIDEESNSLKDSRSELDSRPASSRSSMKERSRSSSSASKIMTTANDINCNIEITELADPRIIADEQTLEQSELISDEISFGQLMDYDARQKSADGRPLSASISIDGRPMSATTSTDGRPMSASISADGRPMSAMTSAKPMSAAISANGRPFSATSSIDERPLSASASMNERPLSATASIDERPLSATASIDERPLSAVASIHERPLSATESLD